MHHQLIKHIRLLHLMENLKTELRRNWLSDGRQESVAEHSWRLALMVVLFGSSLDQPINMEKALKMAILHEIVVAEVGDLAVVDVNVNPAARHTEELRAITNVKRLLNNDVGQEIFTVWQEYQAKVSYEAKFIHALDKLETILQHNEADIATWVQWNVLNNREMAQDDCQFDSYLAQLNASLQEQVDRKLAEAGIAMAS